MATHYESQIGSICGSTNTKRAKNLQDVLDGIKPFPTECHMRGPQARLLYLAGVKINLITKEYKTPKEAQQAEFNSKIKKQKVWEDILELIEDRIKIVGKPPTSLKYVLRFLATKGDIYTKSYLDRTITEKSDRKYINKFFKLENEYAL